MSQFAAEAILQRIQDVDLSLSDFPGGAMDKLVRQLDDDSLSQMALHLDYLSRDEPDPLLLRRLASTVVFLKRNAELREAASSEQTVQELAAQARRTGQETCRCGDRHVEGAHYYVSALDGPKTALLSGPYPTHAECLAALPFARDKALQVDPKSAFYVFGTVSFSGDNPPPSIFGVLDHKKSMKR
jgi:hypothetical protein